MSSSAQELLTTAQRRPEKAPSFWDRMKSGFANIPSDAWLALGSSLLANSWVDPVRGTGGIQAGLGEGLPRFMEARDKARRKSAFEDWMGRNRGALPVDDELLASMDPDEAMQLAVKAQIASAGQENEPPPIKEIMEGGKIVTVMWNGAEWVPVSEAPRWNPTGENGGAEARYQQAGPMRLPDGSVVNTRFNPYGGYEYQGPDGSWSSVPSGSRPTTASSGGSLTPQQFMKARTELGVEQMSIQKLNNYLTRLGDTNTGVKRWADGISANAKTLLGSGKLNPQELALQVARGEVQGLLGLFREDIVGPGVMTEYDAKRVLNALGGDVSALQNPQVVESLLRNLMDTKMQRAQILYEEVSRSAPVYGVDLAPLTPPAPPTPSPDAPRKRIRFDSQGNPVQ